MDNMIKSGLDMCWFSNHGY